MSYFGTVQQMIVSLKNNKKLLRRPKAFSKAREYDLKRTEPKTQLKYTALPPEELDTIKIRIRQKFRRERLRWRAVTLSLISLILVPAAVLVYKAYFTRDFNIVPSGNDVALIEQTEKNESRFNFYINDGYRWLGREQYQNALFQFELAVRLRPDDYQANLGLTKTLLQMCYASNQRCDGAEQKLNSFLKDFSSGYPAQNDIEEFLYILGDTLRLKNIDDVQ